MTIEHRGTRRSYVVKPFAAATLGLGFLACLTLGIGGASYLWVHNGLSDRLTQRAQDIERSYAGRVDRLRTELDAARSGKAIVEATMMTDVAALLERQDEIEARHASVLRVVDVAKALDIVDDTPPLPPLPPASRTTPRVALAFAPSSGSLDADAAPSTHAMHDRIRAAREAVERIDAEQHATVKTVADEADAFLGSLRSAIDDAPLPYEVKAKFGGEGGPYIPIHGAGVFADELIRAEILLDTVQRLRDVSASLPIGTPTYGRRSSGFGSRIDPFKRRAAFHAGVDFAAPTGTPVKATAAGRVSFAGRKGGYGLMVILDHGNGMETRYAHLSRILVSKGVAVNHGERIGKVGSTGRSTGPHLHYETRKDGRAVDPSVYLRAGRKLVALLRD